MYVLCVCLVCLWHVVIWCYCCVFVVFGYLAAAEASEHGASALHQGVAAQ
jgi:hypothetical protein